MAHQGGSARIARNGFRNITASLQGRIEAGEITAGAYLPTERELQAGFGASRATVRKALAALIDSGWAFNVPKKGVVATRGLKPGQSSNVAFIHVDDFSLITLGDRLEEILDERQLDLVHMPGRRDRPMENSLRLAADGNFVGAFVWSYRGCPDGDLIRIAAGQRPIVALDHRIGGTETDLVTFDHEAAAFEATELLIQSGCKRVGVTGMMDMLEITHHRFRGYMRAMFAHGMQPQSRDFLFSYTSGMSDADTTALDARLRSADRPDGFLVLQDFLVSTTAEAATRAGLSLSDDLKLTTIGVVLEPNVQASIIAGIELDWQSLAQQAVELLSERLDNLHRPPHVRFAPHRVVAGNVCNANAGELTKGTDLSGNGAAGSLLRSREPLNAMGIAPQGAMLSQSGEILS
ncbi:MAG TPA: GntR family transcriptional regulator [Fimbriimonas sp.]|nr:GntR family transcriptional regulator [Fimbriimonas sp.]